MTRLQIQNPVLRGFNPDPSILRVGDDYYMATSTFEWFPGVQIHHSRDMVNWQTLSYALDRPDQLDMKGIEASGGVWAPCLTYDEREQTFYLIYTIMRSTNGNAFDLDNYVVTAKNILGPWSGASISTAPASILHCSMMMTGANGWLTWSGRRAKGTSIPAQ